MYNDITSAYVCVQVMWLQAWFTDVSCVAYTCKHVCTTVMRVTWICVHNTHLCVMNMCPWHTQSRGGLWIVWVGSAVSHRCNVMCGGALWSMHNVRSSKYDIRIRGVQHGNSAKLHKRCNEFLEEHKRIIYAPRIPPGPGLRVGHIFESSSSSSHHRRSRWSSSSSSVLFLIVIVLSCASSWPSLLHWLDLEDVESETLQVAEARMVR